MSFLILLTLLFLKSTSTETTPPFRMHVVGQLHEKVTKIEVSIPSLRRSEVLVPDDEGIASIPDLPVGIYKVQLMASGYQSWKSDLEITGKQDRPQLVTLKPGVLGCSPHYSVEYSNVPRQPVSGVVIDADTGRRLRGMRLDWHRPQDKKPLLTVFSNKRGEFTAPQMAPGVYKVVIRDGEFSMDYAVPDKNHEVLTIEVVVARGEVPFIDINLWKKGWIELCR